jgi:UDP-N-acetylglucosamine 2-epimerase
MKVLTVVGARPQFIKAAPVSEALRSEGIDEVFVHTGQHYDDSMSASFFDELDLPEPDHHLAVGSGGHGLQTGLMMQRLEPVVVDVEPSCTLVYGDTNSTLAGALVAAKLHVPIAHVEAGLRSNDRSMPEELNRVVVDHLSAHLYCPSPVAVRNLGAEGIHSGVHLVGDVMYDVLLRESGRLGEENPVAQREGVAEGYVLATIHRPGNTDDPRRFDEIMDAFAALAAAGIEVIWPVHPRTRPRVEARRGLGAIHVVPPGTYRETLALLRDARCAVTDSGGLQKEAFWTSTPCVTVRPSTEWTETVELGWNTLVDAQRDAIVRAVVSSAPGHGERTVYGDGRTADRIAELVKNLATP